jgi:hypothetical protein
MSMLAYNMIKNIKLKGSASPGLNKKFLQRSMQINLSPTQSLNPKTSKKKSVLPIIDKKRKLSPPNNVSIHRLIEKNKKLRPDLFTKLLSPNDLERIGSILNSKKQYDVIKKIDKSYVKLSNKDKYIDISQVSSSLSPEFNYKLKLNKRKRLQSSNFVMDLLVSTEYN